jgi:hypothetical protein
LKAQRESEKNFGYVVFVLPILGSGRFLVCRDTIRICCVRSILERLHTVIRFVSTNAKFGICTVVGLNGTLVEEKMRKF